MLAKALYDNVAESPDELSFRKGDIMTVLERDTQGLDGWWLCSLHGRQGIVPGNRLKILVGMHDKKPAGPGPGPPASLAQPQPGLHNPAAQYTPMLPVAYPPQPDSVYLVPTPSKTQQGLYQVPGPSPQFQSPPAKQTSTFSKQMPHHPSPSHAHSHGCTQPRTRSHAPPAMHTDTGARVEWLQALSCPARSLRKSVVKRNGKKSCFTVKGNPKRASPWQGDRAPLRKGGSYVSDS